MGTPDTVWVKCPKCESRVGFQSKGGPCNMLGYNLFNAPDDVISDVNRHAPVTCKSCKAKLVVLVSGIRGRSVVEVK